MDSNQKQIFEKIREFSFDQLNTDFTFTQRLARENNWNIEYTRRVIEEYRRFVFLAIVTKHTVTPSEQIDQVWHLHLTYTHSYWDDFCPNIVGKPLHHEPTKGGNLEQEKYNDCYRRTLDSYTEYFGCQAPTDIWSSPDIRFGKDLSFKRINTQENWIIPKLNLSLLLNNTVNNLKNRLNRTTTIITSFLIVVFITLGAALPGFAHNSPFYWDFINVNLNIQDNGDILVTEEQKYVFTDLHSPQHYRFFKLDNIKAIDNVRVFEDKKLLPVKTKIKGDEFWIEWQENIKDKDTHLFTLKYRAIGAITNNYGADKLYWKAIFPKRDAVIKKAEVVVELPELLAGKIRNYYNVGGNFKSSLINDKLIKFTSLQGASQN